MVNFVDITEDGARQITAADLTDAFAALPAEAVSQAVAAAVPQAVNAATAAAVTYTDGKFSTVTTSLSGKVGKSGDGMTGTLAITTSGLTAATNIVQTGAGTATHDAFPNLPHAGFAYNYKHVVGDQVVLDNSQISIGRGIVFGDAVDMACTGAGVNGARAAHGAFMRVLVSPATEGNYVGASWNFAQASVPVQGSSSGTPKGALYGTNPQAQLAPGATNWVSLYGQEVDVECDAGANVQYKFGTCITTIGSDAVKGSLRDAALHIGAVPSTQGWKHGIMLSRFNGNGVPVDGTNGTILGTVDTWPCYMGVDLRTVTFSGFAFASTGFTVSGTGNLNAVNAGLSGTLSVAGTSSFSGQVVANNLVANGNAAVGGTFAAVGNSALGGSVTIGGGLNLIYRSPPTTAASAGTPGDVLWDASYLYVCVATNTWKRTALSTW